MVYPKKYLGQHFLKNDDIAKKVVDSLLFYKEYKSVVEVGPGMGALTEFLIHTEKKLYLVEIDAKCVEYLHKKYPALGGNILENDFITLDFSCFADDQMGIIGNFPYNISSQILFKILEEKERVMEVVCMMQKEVAKRISNKAGTKEYGIVSVLLQCWYDIEYLFDVPPEAFHPIPKVYSGVIRLKRNTSKTLLCDEILLKKVVKAGFQQRRKTLKNALKSFQIDEKITSNALFQKRAEQLNVQQFIELTNLIANKYS
ncbi:MAG: 16S rRNA (adenine(1518)-N(6)/adenine(1519)-N(6))-dimethyltransferase RsmA [Chitinophagaceae bacterium]|nr:16S rRNA (adenine(1518)-N(6)/adenine(1519)-N(6))-dimethyltransferase RsmA [Chitinophagaceae bacterium]